jgi:hypothetical protein
MEFYGNVKKEVLGISLEAHFAKVMPLGETLQSS